MRNFIIGAITTCLIAVSGGPALAFVEGDDVAVIERLGDCGVFRQVAAARGIAGVVIKRIQNDSLDFDAAAGGAIWHDGEIISGGVVRAVTAADLAVCIEAEVGNITEFYAVGAGGTYEDDTYIGVSFTLKENVVF